MRDLFRPAPTRPSRSGLAALLTGLALAAACAGGRSVPPPTTSSPAADAGAPQPPRGTVDAGAGATFTPELFRLPTDVRPTQQSIALEVDPTSERFSGRVEIALTLDAPRQDLWVSMRGLEVRSATLARDGTEWAVQVQPDDARGAARVVLGRTVPAGPATLRIAYTAAFDPRRIGLYRVKTSAGWAAYTQFEAIEARHAFPCFDEPGFKIPWDIELVVPAGLQAVANTPVRDESPAAGSARRVRFARTRPLPSYLVAFVVGDFDVRTGTPLAASAIRTTPLQTRGIAPRGRGDELRLGLADGDALLVRLEQWFGLPYPYPKLDHAAVADFAYGAMENAGLITYVEPYLLLDPRKASQDERLKVAVVMAHEMAHQWFGDLVTMQFWDDLWLNESFATLMQREVVAPWKPALHYELDTLAETHEAMRNDELETAQPVRRPIRSEEDIVGSDEASLYPKGAAVLSMFEARMGADRFRDAIRGYLAAHADRNATTEDLLAALERASPGVRSGFLGFVDQPGVPRVSVEVNCDRRGARAVLAQERALPVGSRARADVRWEVPVCLRVEGRSAPVCTTLREARAELTLPTGKRCPRWVHPNAAANGYYRWLLPRAGMDALLGRGWDALSAAEQLSASSGLVDASEGGRVLAEDALAALPRLVRAREPAVAGASVEWFDHARRDWTTAASGPALAARTRALLRPLLARLGWEPRTGESLRTTRLRAKVVETLVRTGRDPDVLARAARLGRAWIGTDGALHPEAVSPDLRKVAAVAAGRTGDAALFDTAVERLAHTESGAERGALVSVLAELPDPGLQERARALTLAGTLRVFERVQLLIEQAEATDDWRPTWRWMVGHQEALAKDLPESATRYLAFAQRGCSDADADEIARAFVGRNDRYAAVSTDAAKAAERARLCGAARAVQAPSLERALARH